MPATRRGTRAGGEKGSSESSEQSGPGALRRIGWGVADQALSSMTNFLVALFVARTVGAASFGAFSIVFATYAVSLGLSRALSSEPLAVRYSGIDPARWRAGVAASAGAVTVMSIAALLACLGATLIADGALRDGFFAVAFFMPGLLLQDAYRLAFFAAGSGRSAFVNDLVWGVLLAAALGVLMVGSDPSVAVLIAAWGATGSIAAVLGAFQARAFPSVGAVGSWWRRQRDLAARYSGEFVAVNLAGQIGLYAVGLFFGLTAAAALRGGQILMGPLNIVFTGAALIAVPEGVRLLRRSQAGLVRGCVLISLVLAASAVVWGAMLSLMPSDVGTELLGDSWAGAETTILPLAVWLVAAGVVAGPAVGLRVLGHAHRSLQLRVVIALAGIAAVVVGANLDGARGGAWGLALATAVSAAVWWREFTVVTRQEPPAAPGVPPEPALLMGEPGEIPSTYVTEA